MWTKSIVIQLGIVLVAGQFSLCPDKPEGNGDGNSNGTAGGEGSEQPDYKQPTLRSISSCQALNGQCVDTRCTDCRNGELVDGLCENSKGKWRKCCRDCPFEPTCRAEEAGFFTTYYGKRFNFQKPGTYVLNKDCVNGMWSVNITLDFYSETATELKSIDVYVGDVSVHMADGMKNPEVIKGGTLVNFGDIPPYTVGDVVMNGESHSGVELTKLEFFGVTVIGVSTEEKSKKSVLVIPSLSYRNKTCGLCGAISDQPSDFTTDSHQLEIKNMIDQEYYGCPYEGTPAGLGYCKNMLSSIKGTCTEKTSFQTYLQACAFAYCQGGTEKSKHVVKDYAARCIKKQTGTCTMYGHTTYNTFDKGYIYHQAVRINNTLPPCTLLMAADCAFGTFRVKITHVEDGLNTKVQKVTLYNFAEKVELIALTKQVKVDGKVVTVPFTSAYATGIYYEDAGNIVTVLMMGGNLKLHYNFHQLVILDLVKMYQGATCGMCGNWNDDSFDDKPFPAPGCRVLTTPSVPEDMEARKLCKNLLGNEIDQECNVCYRFERISTCMYEKHLLGEAGLCGHAKDVRDECYLKRGDDLPEPHDCPRCEDLSSKGYRLFNGTKWLKINKTRITFTQCKDYCETEDTRMVLMRSRADEDAMIELLERKYVYSWLGVRQLSLTTYIWSDGAVMTVNSTSGDADTLQPGYDFWGNVYAHDKFLSEMDPNDCMSYAINQRNFDNPCSSTQYCTCECKY